MDAHTAESNESCGCLSANCSPLRLDASGAKMELRNRFDSIRQRRAPFDGSLSRDTVDTYSASSVLDVPGKKAGTVSSDLEYGVTVRMVGPPSSEDAAASITRATGAAHVL